MITRHTLTLNTSSGPRKVHYRRCGAGPMLLMVHQSPRSSAEYIPLMEKWGAHFTCIAPDTAGFGQSDPLPGEPDIDDFADALAQVVEALGIKGCAAYGFHSGAIILGALIKRQPDLFACVAMGGYAIWTDEERAIFGSDYLPPLVVRPYGEHLTWLWNRVLEETWFFPWFDVRDAAALTQANDDPARVHNGLMMLLDAGPAYRAGYNAVLQAERDLPPPDAVMPPVYINAYRADPLFAHIERMRDMPANWMAEGVETPHEQDARNLAFLQREAPNTPCADLPQTPDEGFVAVNGKLIHWRGERGAPLTLHGPAGEMDDVPEAALVIDVPGHGLSDACDDIAATVHAAAEALGSAQIEWPTVPQGDPAKLYPDLTPDRFGAHLQRAWAPARAEVLFRPWYEASHNKRLPVNAAAIAPKAIARRARARLRAGSNAAAYHAVLSAQ